MIMFIMALLSLITRNSRGSTDLRDSSFFSLNLSTLLFGLTSLSLFVDGLFHGRVM
jgi:hypothetical protein